MNAPEANGAMAFWYKGTSFFGRLPCASFNAIQRKTMERAYE
jgi:hypothetical protein